jgi:hypothetical protein
MANKANDHFKLALHERIFAEVLCTKLSSISSMSQGQVAAILILIYPGWSSDLGAR